MDIESYKALSQVIVHDTLSVVKQLQKELAKEKRAHKLTTRKHESLLEFIDQDWGEHIEVFYCPGCGCTSNTHNNTYYSTFTFRRNEAGVLKLENVLFCQACDYENVSSKLKASKWLEPIPDWYYEENQLNQRIYDDEVTEHDLKLAAALIIQHAFRRDWDWRKPRMLGENSTYEDWYD